MTTRYLFVGFMVAGGLLIPGKRDAVAITVPDLASTCGTTGGTSGVNGCFKITNNHTGASAFGITGVSSGPAPAVKGTGSSGPGVQGTSTSGLGVQGTSTSGVGVTGTSTSSTGVTGSSSATNGTGIAGTASGTGTSAKGVSGTSINGYGVYGSSTGTVISATASGVYGTSSNGSGVTGVTTANSGTVAGVYGYTQTTNAFAILGENLGPSDSNSAIVGRIPSTDYLGNPKNSGFAVRGILNSTGGIAVYGQASNGGVGVSAEATTGIGVLAVSTSNHGIESSTSGSSAAGVHGISYADSTESSGVLGTATGQGYAIVGSNPASNGWAGVFFGNVWASGTYQGSDARLKKDVQELPYGLKDLLRLRPVSYKWQDEAKGHDRQLGLIAQEVQKVVPEIVTTAGPAKMLGVNYTALVPVTIKAVQEQERTIEAQAKLIADLNRRVAALEASKTKVAGSSFGTLGLALAALGMALPVGVVIARRKKNVTQ